MKTHTDLHPDFDFSFFLLPCDAVTSVFPELLEVMSLTTLFEEEPPSTTKKMYYF